MRYEILELCAEIAFKFWRLHLRDQEEQLHGMLSAIRRFSGDEFDGGDPE